jgi:hypothetical protein
MAEWRDRVETLPEEQRLMFEGGSLSQLFLRLPLMFAHPTFVGAFYGLLIATATLLPTLYIGIEVHSMTLADTLRDWLYLGLQMVLITGLLGGISAIFAAITKRPPISLENKRKWLFPVPFIGLVLLSAGPIAPELAIPSGLAWLLLMSPGPIYIHLSYAPRWRILDRLDRGRSIEGEVRYDEERPEQPTDADVSAAVEELAVEE